MENMALRVNIEGRDERVSTDWFAIMGTLKNRGLDRDALLRVHAELNAGLKVTTRSLTLAKLSQERELVGIVRSAHEYRIGA